jgi:cell division protein FtsB
MDLRVVKKLPKLPNPEDGLRTLVEHAPQAEAMAEEVVERFRPAYSTLVQYRRRAATLVVMAITGWLFVHVVFGANGTMAYRQKQAEIEQLQQEVKVLQKETDARNQEIIKLRSDPATVEKVAREDLGYVRQGEWVFVAPPQTAVVPVPKKSAQK